MLRQCQGSFRRCAGPLVEGDQFCHHVDGGADFLCRLGNTIDDRPLSTVTVTFAKVARAAKRRTFPLANDVVGDLDIAETGRQEDFCLTDFLTGDADSASFEL